MKTEIKIPAVGESVNEATISAWQKSSGDTVKRDEVLLTLETDKANVDVVAENDGVLEIKEAAGTVLPIGAVVGYLNSQASAGTSSRSTLAASAQPTPRLEERANPRPANIPASPPPAGSVRPPTVNVTKSIATANGSALIEIKVPAVGESITEATLGQWSKKNGEAVRRDDVLVSLETDKATVDITAEKDGVLEVLTETGTIVKIGTVIGRIRLGEIASNADIGLPKSAPPSLASETNVSAPGTNETAPGTTEPLLSPAVRRVVSAFHLDPQEISGSGRGGRITKEDAEKAAWRMTKSGEIDASVGSSNLSLASSAAPTVVAPVTQVRKNGGSPALQGHEKRVKMTTIRRRIAERLVYAQQTAAILTTFNEINMGAAVALRARYKEAFKERYGVGLGYMGLFAKACIEALRTYPEVNAFIEEDEIVYHDTYNIGVAVGGPKGLIVPVLHHAESMSLAEIELKIKEYAEKARSGKIAIDDLSGGTFTISNGGTYGSMMSTPILNPPQSGILGMHKIEDRPIAVNGKVEIHPMMYVALSYDHRVIDGEGAVKFLVKVKECLEDPNRLLLEI